VNKVLSSLLPVLVSFLSSGQPATGNSVHEYLEKTKDLNPIEGIWKLQITREFYHSDTLYEIKQIADSDQVSIIKTGTEFTAYYLKGDSFNLDFTTTDVKGVYMYRNFYPLTADYSKKQAVICTHGKMEFTYDLPIEYAIKYCGENYQPNTRVVHFLKWKKVFPATQ
jgi:hypothetical protein